MLTTTIIALLLGLGMADCITTYIGLKQPDVSEANPVAAPVLKLLGVIPGMLLLKILCTAIIVSVVLVSGWWWLGAIFVAGYVYVLWSNVKVIRESAR